MPRTATPEGRRGKKVSVEVHSPRPSNILNSIGCLDKPTYGVIRLDGDDLSSLDAKQLTEVRRDKIGLISQQFHLIPHLTVM